MTAQFAGTDVDPQPSRNDALQYSAWSVYARQSPLTATVAEAHEEVVTLAADLETHGVTIRGFYDLAAMRPDADLMVWWHAPDAAALQLATRRLRRTAIGRATTTTWSAMGLHRPAEFSADHQPAFMSGAPARGWVAVYPFIRSYGWYLLPPEQRSAMLAEHGLMGREHPTVLSNTVAAFALGDWEWILALEADDLHDIVDLMRHLRSSETRLHVRAETPFFTGRLIDTHDVYELLRRTPGDPARHVPHRMSAARISRAAVQLPTRQSIAPVRGLNASAARCKSRRPEAVCRRALGRGVLPAAGARSVSGPDRRESFTGSTVAVLRRCSHDRQRHTLSAPDLGRGLAVTFTAVSLSLQLDT